jgi:rhodanese-related sulfurtransferase
VSTTPATGQDVTDEELPGALEAGATLVEVREAAEYVSGHAPGARLMPMGQLPARVAELVLERPVYLICASGNRSAAMTEFLTHAGFEAYSVAGGTAAWVRSGRPVNSGNAV